MTLYQPLLTLSLVLLLGLCLLSLLLLHLHWWEKPVNKSWLRSRPAQIPVCIQLVVWWAWWQTQSFASEELGWLASGHERYWTGGSLPLPGPFRFGSDPGSTWCCGLPHHQLPGASHLLNRTGGASGLFKIPPSETEARVYCSAAGPVFPQIEPFGLRVGANYKPVIADLWNWMEEESLWWLPL